MDLKNIYFEKTGNGEKCLLFIHGNSSSSKSFKNQMDSHLNKKHTLIAVDLPGHGNTKPATDTATYSIPGYANFIKDFITKNQLKNVILVGWSLGGHISIECLEQINQLIGIVIFGTPPLAYPPEMDKAFLPNEAVNVGFLEEVSKEQAAAYANSFFKPNTNIDTTPFVEDIIKTHGVARSAMAASIGTIGYKDEVIALENTKLPVLIIHGKQEQLVSSTYITSLNVPTLWQTKVQFIENAGHAPHIETPEKFNEILALYTAQF